MIEESYASQSPCALAITYYQHEGQEGEETGLYLIRDPVGRNKLMTRGRQRSTAQRSTLQTWGGPWACLSPAEFSHYPGVCGSLLNALKVGASGDTRAVLASDST
jgi:hypothetical protein